MTATYQGMLGLCSVPSLPVIVGDESLSVPDAHRRKLMIIAPGNCGIHLTLTLFFALPPVFAQYSVNREVRRAGGRRVAATPNSSLHSDRLHDGLEFGRNQTDTFCLALEGLPKVHGPMVRPPANIPAHTSWISVSYCSLPAE